MSVENRTFADAAPIVSVLGDDGTILRVNDAWKTFGERNGLSPEYEAVGENYLDVTAEGDDEYAARVETGLRELLAGERSLFTTVYPCHGPDERRWFRLWATPVVDAPRVLVAHHRVAAPGPNRRPEHGMDGRRAATPGGTREAGRLVTYPLGPDEPLAEGILVAFDSLGIDVESRETRLYDWVDVDVLEALGRTTETFELAIPVWEYRVVLTPDAVTIRDPSVGG